MTGLRKIVLDGIYSPDGPEYLRRNTKEIIIKKIDRHQVNVIRRMDG
jgi:hypothetical protein